MKTVVVIPARFNSTRLPAKMLRDISGMPMIVRTARQVQLSKFPLWVAYDDARIAAVLQAENINTLATSAVHENGTERLSEVVSKQGWDDDTVVVNVQGDEPLIPPELIRQVAETLHDAPHAAVATLAAKFDSAHSPAAATTVKVVCNQNSDALYFSRAAVPYVRDADGVGASFPYLRHIGIYAYRASILRIYPQLAPTPLEQAEKLEQLRFLEHGYTIAVKEIDKLPPPGVDCEEDLRRVEAVIAAQ